MWSAELAISYDDPLTTVKIRKPHKPEGAVKIPAIVVADVVIEAVIIVAANI